MPGAVTGSVTMLASLFLARASVPPVSRNALIAREIIFFMVILLLRILELIPHFARPHSKRYFKLFMLKRLNIHHEGHAKHEEK